MCFADSVQLRVFEFNCWLLLCAFSNSENRLNSSVANPEAMASKAAGNEPGSSSHRSAGAAGSIDQPNRRAKLGWLNLQAALASDTSCLAAWHRITKDKRVLLGT